MSRAAEKWLADQMQDLTVIKHGAVARSDWAAHRRADLAKCELCRLDAQRNGRGQEGGFTWHTPGCPPRACTGGWPIREMWRPTPRRRGR